VASQFPRTATTVAIPTVAEAASGALGVGIESISIGYDIYKKQKEHKAGKISTLKFNFFSSSSNENQLNLMIMLKQRRKRVVILTKNIPPSLTRMKKIL
jgi:hypothetical protein